MIDKYFEKFPIPERKWMSSGSYSIRWRLTIEFGWTKNLSDRYEEDFFE